MGEHMSATMLRNTTQTLDMLYLILVDAVEQEESALGVAEQEARVR